MICDYNEILSSVDAETKSEYDAKIKIIMKFFIYIKMICISQGRKSAHRYVLAVWSNVFPLLPTNTLIYFDFYEFNKTIRF